MIRWRELLSSQAIHWVDRGPSITRGNIAIQCPWCGNADPSQHLSLNEESGAYNCWRVTGHGGHSPYYLLRALGIRGDLTDLITLYGGTSPRIERERPQADLNIFAKRWATFRPAALDAEARDYLRLRGFWNPVRTANRFDLRVASGHHAGRLWFPFYYGNDVAGYTGRSMRGHQIRYMTEAASTYLYLPRLPYDTDRLILLVEGPLDALRLADATEDRYDLLTAALCGLSLTPDKRLQLWSLAKLIPQVFIVPDSTVSVQDANRLRKELHALAYGQGIVEARVRRLDLPPGIDDPGEMTGEDIELWLRATGIAKLVSQD